MVLSLTRQVLFLIPLLLILPLFWGLDGILFAGPVADFSAFVVTTLLIMKEMKHMRKMPSQA